MKVYVVSLGAGILVGIVYSLLSVRSPAPPIVALLGLFGMLLGEQVLPVTKRIISGCGIIDAIEQADCKQHVFGELPANADGRDRPFQHGDR